MKDVQLAVSRFELRVSIRRSQLAGGLVAAKMCSALAEGVSTPLEHLGLDMEHYRRRD